MNEIIRISAFFIITAIIVILVRIMRPEMAGPVLVASSVIVFTYIANVIGGIFDSGIEIVDKTGLDKEQIALLFKVIIAVYVMEFARGICIDLGETGLAQKIDMCARVYLIILILPTCISLITTITSFIQ